MPYVCHLTADDWFAQKSYSLMTTTKPLRVAPLTTHSTKVQTDVSIHSGNVAAESSLVDVQIAGKIETDMTRLRDEGKILHVFPVQDAKGATRGKARYEVSTTWLLLSRVGISDIKRGTLQVPQALLSRRGRSALLLLFSLGRNKKASKGLRLIA
jgi:hypothetical protein